MNPWHCLAVAAALSAGGCGHEADKALRGYDAALEPARTAIRQVQSTQPALAERRAPERLRTIARSQVLPAVDAVLTQLEAVHPSDNALNEHHLALIALWRGYRRSIEEFADGLTGATLPLHRDALETSLEALWSRFNAWNTELMALDEAITRWG